MYKLYSNEGWDGSPFHLITAYDGVSFFYTVLEGDQIGESGISFTTGKIYTFKFTAINEVGESEIRYLAPTLRVALGAIPVTPL